MDMPQDPTAMQDAAPQKTVCIAEVGDSTYSVYLEGQGPMEGDQMGETVAKSLDQALQAAAQMLQGDGAYERAEQEKGFAQGAQGL